MTPYLDVGQSISPECPYKSGETLSGEALLSLITEQPLKLDVLENLKSLGSGHAFSLGHDVCDGRSPAQESSEEPTSNADSHSVEPHPILSNFYVIYRGGVRLLCHQKNHVRGTTVQRLEAGDVFGADRLFLDAPLVYSAIALSDCELITIPNDVLMHWMDECPPLKERLLLLTRIRQQVIFLRQFTDLSSVVSAKLQQLSPYLMEQHISANTVLSEACRSEAGCFWLRAGTIRGQSHPIPDIGSRWGYPHPVPSDWRADTDVLLYHLPMHYWERARTIVPELEQQVLPDGGKSASPVIGSGSVLAPAPHAGVTGLETVKPGHGRSPSSTYRIGQPHAIQPSDPSSKPSIEDDHTVLFPKPIQRRLLDTLRRYPWVEQQSSSDCGAACLSMMCKYWGKQVPLHVLRGYANVGREGTTLRNLAEAAEGLGFQTRPVRASLNRIEDQTNPWIAHWQGNHYIVVYRVEAKRVLIADPAIARKWIPRQDFLTQWTGYALLLDPTNRFNDLDVKNQTSLWRYISALSPYRSIIGQIILVSFVIQMFGLVTPLLTQIILDKVVVQRSLETLNVVAIGLVLFSIWGLCMSSVRQYLLSYFSNRIDLTLISGFIHHAISLPMQFFESRRVGDILTRVQENQKIQRFLIGQVVLSWLNFVTGFVYLGLMLYYNWKLTLLVIALIPPIIIVTLASTPLLRKVSREIFKEVADQNSSLVEMMTGISTVKTVAVERELRWRWEDHLTRQLNARFKGQKLGIGLGAINGLINTVGSTGLLWYGASLVINGQLTIGQLVAFNMMTGYVISPVIALANLWDELQEILISVERLNDVFETQVEELPSQQLLLMPAIRGDVEFENVTFKYNKGDEHNTLQNLTFSVSAGQTIAIVGRSGSGKTTLIKLLEKLYPPDQGRIFIDGHDIAHVSPQSLRSQLGVVPQDCFLFSGTIFENITLHRPDFTLEDVVAAAKLAEAHVFIQSMPLGYSTVVGERGSTLSGGQRQRIAIARALLGNPRILILDEATSSLDTESEQRFQQNLAQVSRDRTTFIIAHRLSTVRDADQILVLDRGVLVEQGSHDDLIAAKGIYYHLAHQQLNL